MGFVFKFKLFVGIIGAILLSAASFYFTDIVSDAMVAEYCDGSTDRSENDLERCDIFSNHKVSIVAGAVVFVIGAVRAFTWANESAVPVYARYGGNGFALFGNRSGGKAAESNPDNRNNRVIMFIFGIAILVGMIMYLTSHI